MTTMYGSYNWVEGWLYEIKIEKTHSRERSMVVVKEKSKAKKLFTFVVGSIGRTCITLTIYYIGSPI